MDSPAIDLHKRLKGKLSIDPKMSIKTMGELALAYTPGAAEPSREIAEDITKVYDYTMKGNTVAIITDGSSVLGLGNIGAEASLPVMEGKAMLMKEFANIDSFPIALKTQNPKEIISIVKNIAPVFGGINLEDIKAPQCFEVEDGLQGIGIPVMHDDQHGTAIVVLAALINASKVVGKSLDQLKIVVIGAGAAGSAITNFLSCFGNHNLKVCQHVKDVLLCDSKGIISKDREGLIDYKKELANISNKDNQQGSLEDALKGADVVIGVSRGNLLTEEMIKTMAKDPIVIAMSNPIPEIMPDKAKNAGAKVVATGRSDFPNQVNNVLAFPGMFRGALDARIDKFTDEMKIEAAYALAGCVENPTPEKIIPSVFEPGVAEKIANAIKKYKK